MGPPVATPGRLPPIAERAAPPVPLPRVDNVSSPPLIPIKPLINQPKNGLLATLSNIVLSLAAALFASSKPLS